MTLSIRQRLALTYSLLTALVLIPAGLALYFAVSGGIAAQGSRAAEAAARNLVFRIRGQWDEDLLMAYQGSADPLEQITLDVRDWGLVWGSGENVRMHGVLKGAAVTASPRASRLVETADGQVFRTGSAPLLESELSKFDDLREAVRSAVLKECPQRLFLRATREPDEEVSSVEVAMLVRNRIVELEIASDGRVIAEDEEILPEKVPGYLASTLTSDMGATEVKVASWTGYNGQLIAIVEGRDRAGGTTQVAVNRLGERFLLDGKGGVSGPRNDSRLWLVTALDARGETAARTKLAAVLCVGGPVVWLGIVLVGWYVTGRAFSPVKTIVDTVERIEVSQLNGRLPVGRAQDELTSIAVTVNRMLERIERGYKREKQFTGDAAHELRGPLAKMIADTELALSRQRGQEFYRATVSRCHTYAKSMQRLVESLLLLAQLDRGHFKLNTEVFDIGDLLVDTAGSFGRQEAARIRVDLEGSEHPLLVPGDRELTGIMCHNLIENALQYSPAEESVLVQVCGGPQAVVVRVLDRGKGIPEESCESVFLRFFRVDKSRSKERGGAGLGLSIVKAIAEAHGTRVKLHKRPGGGTEVTFSLPAAAQ